MGRVHSIETLGGLDGPGMRCVVFLQGCPMRCLYCHNPDTWDPADGTEMSVEQVMARVERTRPYFGRRGGVTLSGGEPFLQAAFAAELLRQCRQAGIHTAVDTCGFYLNDDVRAALNCTDLVLLDIKHLLAEEHRELTGSEIERPRKFLEYLQQEGIAVWLRQVVVPGWTDSESYVEQLAALANELPTLERIELLPYHTLARDKWVSLGLPYSLTDVPEPSPSQMDRLRTVLRDRLGDVVA